jgi:hypothetical protein
MESTNDALKLIAKAKEALKNYLDCTNLHHDDTYDVLIHDSCVLLDQAIDKLAGSSSS